MDVVTQVIRLVDTNKAKFAFLVPLLVAAFGATGEWILTGEFNAEEIRTAAAGVVLAVGAAAGAYFASPGDAVVDADHVRLTVAANRGEAGAREVI